MTAKKPLPMVAQGKWRLCGVPDKEKSQLIRWRWGTDTTAEVLGPPGRKSACLLGPPWLINRDMSHQRLGHLGLFQNLGQCFSSITKRLKFGEGVEKSVPETDFLFSQWQMNKGNGRIRFSLYSTSYLSFPGCYHYVEGTSFENMLLIFTKLQMFFLYRGRVIIEKN